MTTVTFTWVREFRPARKTRVRKPTLFPGICADAAFLGVNRSTLYRVLSGEWPQLKTLRRRYDALKSSQVK